MSFDTIEKKYSSAKVHRKVYQKAIVYFNLKSADTE